MPNPTQRRILAGLAENAPTIVFLTVMNATGELRPAGWLASVAAAMVFIGFVRYQRRLHPILLGINLFMLAAAPGIEAVFLAGFDRAAALAVANIQTGVFLAVLLTGLVLTLCGRGGLLGTIAETAERPALLRHRALEWVMNALCAGMVLWSLAFAGDRLWSIALPMAILFGTRQYLLAGGVATNTPEAKLALSSAAPAALSDRSIRAGPTDLSV